MHSYTQSLALTCDAPNLLTRLLPLLDGCHRMNDIVRDLRGFGEDRVRDLLDQLLEDGILEEAPSAGSTLSPEELRRYRRQITFFSHFLSLPGNGEQAWPGAPKHSVEFQERLKDARVVVIGLGRLGSHLVRQLALAGVGSLTGVDDERVGPAEVQSDAWFGPEHAGQLRGDALTELVKSVNPSIEFTSATARPETEEAYQELLAGASFAVLCSDHFRPEQYDLFNRACLRADRCWTSCRLIGFEFLVGPTVIPRKTACYKCFDLRQKGNLTDYEEYLLLEEFLNHHPLDSGMLAITPGIGVLSLEVVKAITHFVGPATYGHLFAFNMLTLESRRHRVLKLPRCPHCGRPSQGRPTIQIWQQT